MSLNRRRLLRAAGTLAVGTTLAGCVGGFSPREEEPIGERPAYSRWIGSEHLDTATEERDGLLFLRTGFRELRELEEPEDAFGDFGDGVAEGDAYQLALAPLWGAVAFMMVSSLGLIAYGNAAAQVMEAMQAGMSADGTETESEPPHTIDAGVSAGRLVAFEGDFDVDALDEAVESFEATEEYGGFQLYEGTEERGSMLDTSDLSFAVSENAILLPFPGSNVEEAEEWGSLETAEILKSHVDVAAGDAEEAADGNEDFEWTLRAGGGEAFVLGGHGLEGTGIDRPAGSTTEEPELDRLDPLLRDARSFALSMSFDVDGEAILAEGGFSYSEEASRPEETAFEDLAEGATTSSVAVDGSRASVEATWTGEEAQ